MWNQEQKNIWQDIKDTWKDQPQSEKINIQLSQLLNEFKSKVSQFEKDSIISDITTLKANWIQTKREKVSQFEKNSMKRDINIISKFLQRLIAHFRKKK